MKKGKRLEMLIEKNYKNVNQFAKVIGVPYTTIKSMIDRDLSKANVDNVVRIAKELNVTVEYLTKDEDSVVEMDKSGVYSYFPTSISAGLPSIAESVAHYETEEINVPNSVMGKWSGDRDIYMMRVNGESMNRIIPNGSLIAVKPISPHNLKDGDIVVYSDDHDYAVKRYYRDDNRLIFRPDSEDGSFYDYITDTSNNNLEIHGKVVVYIVEMD